MDTDKKTIIKMDTRVRKALSAVQAIEKELWDILRDIEKEDIMGGDY